MKRFAIVLLILGLGATLAPVLGHPRAVRHRHNAVIVVGKPRPARNVLVIHGVRHGVLDMNVKPKTTEVHVDGRYRGTCDEFDGFPGKLALRPGVHRVRLITPDGLDVTREVRVRAGVEVNVGLDLR